MFQSGYGTVFRYLAPHAGLGH